MNHVRIHIAFVSILNLVGSLIGACIGVLTSRFEPSHLTVAMHLGIDKITNVVSTIGPLEFSEAIDLGIDEVASINVVLILLGASAALTFNELPPLFEALPVHLLVGTEVTSYLDCSELEFLHTLPSHFVSHPVAIVLTTIQWLSVAALAMEKSHFEATFVDGAIWERFDSSAFRIFIDKGALDSGAISIGEHSIAFLHTVLPCTSIHRTVAPLACAEASHAAHEPLAFVFPALLLADKHAMTSLVSVGILAVVKVTIGELADTVTVGDVVTKVAVVEFAFGERILAESFHLTLHPVAFVRFLESNYLFAHRVFVFIAHQVVAGHLIGCLRGPDHLTLAMWLTFKDLATVHRAIRQVKLTITSQRIFLVGEAFEDDAVAKSDFSVLTSAFHASHWLAAHLTLLRRADSWGLLLLGTG